MKKFAIGIPTLNRADLLIPALEKYIKDFCECEVVKENNMTSYKYSSVAFFIIDNGNQEDLQKWVAEKNTDIKVWIHYYAPTKNYGVAKSWNYLCDTIYLNGYEWALILNDDIYLGYDEHLVNNVINDYPNHSLIQSNLNFSVILLGKEMYEDIGRFDEEFYPAYYEDSDYLYRMKLKGIRQEVDLRLNPKDARVSQTYEKAPEFVNNAMKYSRLRYIEKWGNLPLLETYKTPFNGKDY